MALTPLDCESIKTAARQIGFDLCGIAAAGPIPRADFLNGWLAAGYAGTMSYLHRHRDSRVDVRGWLPWARSVIVAAMNYQQENVETPKRRNAETEMPPDAKTPKRRNAETGEGEAPTEPEAGEVKKSRIQKVKTVSPDALGRDIEAAECGASRPGPRGRVAMYAWGEDYHAVLRERLDALVARMRELITEPFQSRVCVDTTAISERALAAAAGIGWIGKNTMVLHSSLGSFFFLGEIITDLVLPPDAPLTDHCGTCTRCLDACPTAAFPRPYVMDARRCISYLTIEHRSEIDPALAAKMGDWVFGCDICQDVCPYNRRSPAAAEPRFQGDSDHARPLLGDILTWDDAAYRAWTRGRATRRAKPAMWRRNAEIVLRNAGFRRQCR